MDTPLRCEPFLRPMVWGGRRLETALGKRLPAAGPYGESWEISDHAVHRSVVAQGPFAGRSLRELMATEQPGLLGPAASRWAIFPWLVKFLDACDWLSVQVHPDDVAVRQLWPGESGKTEAWFVLDADPGSRIFAGLLPGVDETGLRAAVAAGSIADCLHSFTPQPGDCVFLPAGTVHAIGGGVLLAEVQQTSDATFRLFDWNRRDAQGKSRELHVEQALASIDWTRGPVTPVRVPDFPRPGAEARVPARQRQTLVECPYFRLEYLQDSEAISCGGRGCLQVVVILHGHGRLTTVAGNEDLHVGQTWLLPAALPAAWCHPEPGLRMLVCTLPEM